MTAGPSRAGRPRRPSPAFVISCISLFVALSGTALALEANSVRSRNIVDETIRTRDLRDNSVKNSKINDNAVTRTKLDDNAVGSIEVEDGSLNASDLGTNSVGSDEIVDQSVVGVDIGPNAVGASELAPGGVQAGDLGVTSVKLGPSQAVNANSSGGAFVNCDAGDRRISGGVSAPGSAGVSLQSSFPNGVNGWTVIVRNDTAAQIQVQAYVLCLQG